MKYSLFSYLSQPQRWVHKVFIMFSVSKNSCHKGGTLGGCMHVLL